MFSCWSSDLQWCFGTKLFQRELIEIAIKWIELPHPVPQKYGTKKVIEGDFTQGQNCLIVEDVITSGSSVLETASILRDHGLKVEEVVVFLDREQGGRHNLENNGIRVDCVVTVTRMMGILQVWSQTQKNFLGAFVYVQ